MVYSVLEATPYINLESARVGDVSEYYEELMISDEQLSDPV